MSLVELWCSVDDFCQADAQAGRGEQLGSGEVGQQRAGAMHLSEIMTLVIYFHPSHNRVFNAYYTEHVQVHLRREFPKLVSDGRCVELMPRSLPDTNCKERVAGTGKFSALNRKSSRTICRIDRTTNARLDQNLPQECIDSTTTT
jgi:hypothetical protein